MKTMTPSMPAPAATRALPLPFAGPFHRPSVARWWQVWSAWWSGRRPATARHVDEALCGLSPHVLRDIGAPVALFACALERDAARPLFADLEMRS